MADSAISRRGFMARALRAGVAISALALAGCGGPETHNSRREDVAGGAEEESAVPASPLAISAAQQEQEEEAPAAVAEREAAEEQVRQQAQPTRDLATIPIVERPVPDDVVDPLVWRERYHWRELAKLAGQEMGPVRGGGLHVHGPTQISWTPFEPRLQMGRVGTFLPLIYSQLVVMAAGDHHDAHHGEIEGDLAASWEIPEPTTLLFNIHEDVNWPDEEPLDGRALTASDVRISHDAYRSPTMPQGSAYGAVEQIEADDREMTVRFRLSEPASYLPAQMTGPLHVIAPPHQLDDPSEAFTVRNGVDHNATPLGTGPFRMQWSSLASWGAVRNPSYFKRDRITGERLPYFARIRGGVLMSRVPSSYTFTPRHEIWRDWTDRQFDAIELIEPSELEESSTLFPDFAAQVVAPTPGRGSALTFRATRGGPFADVRVRHALSAAIDRVEIAKRMHHGLAAPDCGHDWTHVTDDSSESGFREWPWTPEELGEPYTFDPARARALLSAAGYSALLPLTINLDASSSSDRFVTSVNPGEVAVVAHQWQQHLGEAAEVRLLPRSVRTFRQQRSERTINEWHQDARIVATVPLPEYLADPDPLTYGRLHSSVNPLVQDAELDELCQQQRTELDPARRSQLLEQIRLRDLDLSWRLPLVNRYGLVARQGNIFNVGGTHIAHSFDLNPKQFERAWRLPPQQ